MRLTKVAWEDLLGRPFQFGGRGEGALDCAGVTEEILNRAGLNVPGRACFPEYDGPRSAPDALEAYLDEQAAKWVAIDRPTDVGDIVTSDPSRRGRPTHVSVVVDLKPLTFLSATRGVGVTASDSVPGKIAAYRLREAAR